MDEHRELLTDHTIAFAEYVARISGDTGNGWTQIEAEAELWAPIADVLESYDALLCPTLGTRGLIAGDDYYGHGLEVGGEQLDFYFETLITPVFNILSACPVLNVPSGFADNNVPTGLQIVGRTFDDATTFQIGAALERERPWLDTPEHRPLQ